MTASATATFSNAKSRALYTSGTSRLRASDSPTRFHMVAGESKRAAQKRAVAASSARSGVVAAVPIVFTSLKSCAYRALDNAGGGPGRKADGDEIDHGAIGANCPEPGVTAGGDDGGVGVGCQNGSGSCTYAGSKAPVTSSLARQAQIPLATPLPPSGSGGHT